MSNKIILKKSSVANRVPITDIEDADAGLSYGELAINYTDGKLYYKTAANAIGQIGGNIGSGTLRVFQRGDVTQEDAVQITTNSGILTVECRTVTYPSGAIGVLV